MHKHKPSVTMQAVAAVRRKHENILGKDVVARNIMENLPDAITFKNKLDELSNGMFSRSVVVRTAFYNNALNALKLSFDQVVILGLGLDFKFLNINTLKPAKKFCIDHPNSLNFSIPLIKPYQALLSQCYMIGMDLSKETSAILSKKLEDEGFKKTASTLFLWEGCTYYFTPKGVEKIISWISSLVQNNAAMVITDFVNKDTWSQLPTNKTDARHQEFNNANHAMTALNDIKEPWYGYFTIDEIKKLFKQFGFKVNLNWEHDIEKDIYNENKIRKKSMCYAIATKFFNFNT